MFNLERLLLATLERVANTNDNVELTIHPPEVGLGPTIEIGPVTARGRNATMWIHVEDDEQLDFRVGQSGIGEIQGSITDICDEAALLAQAVIFGDLREEVVYADDGEVVRSSVFVDHGTYRTIIRYRGANGRRANRSTESIEFDSYAGNPLPPPVDR